MRIYDRERAAVPAGQVLMCSELVMGHVLGPPQRGFVQSAFPAAANLLFPDGFWLSLNTLPASFPQEFSTRIADQADKERETAGMNMRGESDARQGRCSMHGISGDHGDFPMAGVNTGTDGEGSEGYGMAGRATRGEGDARQGRRYIHRDNEYGVDLLSGEHFLHVMPNGLLLNTRAGAWPVGGLRPGMPVILGAGRLVIEDLACSLECDGGRRWSPRITRPERLDEEQLRVNAAWLARFCRSRRPPFAETETETETETLPEYAEKENILALAERLCGRGRGLTPAGDDFLAGWMAAGWLLNGPQPAFLADCRRILEIAEQRTHALSRCWLTYAANGAVAHPITTLLTALTTPDHVRLARAAAHTLALGATSGYDLLQGILFGFAQFLPDQKN